ncbi:DNA polymerase, partial [Candidatus Micrarchaeota archaeon CG11_big_fil_rev_8_21_14_0_20_47_5]
TIERLRTGKVPLEELTIYTQLKKDPSNYEIMSPELSAAKKAIKRGVKLEKGAMIGYVIAKKGASISEKAEIAEYAKDYDADYYINRQILPSVLKILAELGFSEDDLKFAGSQSNLGKYF